MLCQYSFSKCQILHILSFIIKGEPTEQLLTELESEIEKIEAFHKSAANVFEGVQQWMVQWRRFVDLEVCIYNVKIKNC